MSQIQAQPFSAGDSEPFSCGGHGRLFIIDGTIDLSLFQKILRDNVHQPSFCN